MSNVVHSQFDLHEVFGGVVPEIASRAHTERITAVVDEALTRAGVTGNDLDAIAVTNRPGLVGSLMVGVSAAKTLAWGWDKPLIGVHHIEAHCVAAMAEYDDLDYPFAALVASGGHTAIYQCDGPQDIRVLGATIDDAAGECFDKVAVLLDLPQPGGPHVSQLAKGGDPEAVSFPRGRVKGAPLDFSFSGLKTAVLYFLKGPGGKKNDPDRADLPCSRADVAASFERAVADVLTKRTLQACGDVGATRLVIGGGVAANRELRRLFTERMPPACKLFVPSPPLCADNGAMIALRGHELLMAGHTSALDLDVRATGEDGI